MLAMNRKRLIPLLLLAGSVLLGSFATSSVSLAQEPPPYTRLVRVMEADETDVPNPAGLAFSFRANAFYIMEGPKRGQANSDLIKLTPFGDRAGSARIAAAIWDPRNMAFDGQRNRLLIFQSLTNTLIEVGERPDGNLDPGKLIHHDARHFGLQNPQGMTVDPVSGHVFILDAIGPRLVRVEPEPDGTFDGAVISEVDLQPTGLVDVQGVAFDPTTSHLHLLAGQELYELTQTGQVVATRDLTEFGLRDPQGMMFAPSGDQTDDPSEISLYITDQGNATAQAPGGIVELSFTEPVAAAASSFTSSLVRTTDMAAFSPPSPDPSGLTYLPNSNRLMMCDGEVEETVNGITHFRGANVWELTLSGGVLRTANISKVAPTVVPMTNEPTGVTWNPVNGHYFFTDDGGKEVYDLNPGADGLVGTADDSWTHFDTLAVGNGDPEGIAFDTRNNRLFVADGVNREVYQYTLAGSLVSHFDVQAYGVEDPETVEFNPDSGTLFVMSSNRTSPVIVETTISGALLQTIDISAPNARQAAGLAYAPASNGSGTKRFYIVDRGVDNNTDPKIIDGKMYEMTSPSAPPVNTAPVVSAGPNQTITLPNNATLDGTVSDDGLPNPPGVMITTWSKVSGPGTVTFGNASAVDTTASFSVEGTYTLRLTADDSALSASDDVIVTVNPASGNTAPVVSAGPDQTITLPSNAILDGTVTDDGLPTPPALTTTWSQVSGSGTVTFGNASAVDTMASFSAEGVYTLRLSASDGALSASDDIIITVNPPSADLIFADGFESGNLSAWSSSRTDAGDLSVSAAAALVGVNGMQAVIDDNKIIYVTDDWPSAEPRYRARFYFDPNSIPMANGDAHFIFDGFAGTSRRVLRVEFRQSSGNYQLRARLLNDSTTWTNTSWFTISNAPHFIELDWRAATAAGANDGGLTLWIDGAQQAGLTGIDNDTRRIDRVRLGAVAGIDTGTRGTTYFDAFESRRQTTIGP